MSQLIESEKSQHGYSQDNVDVIKDTIKNKVADLARIHGLDKTKAWTRELVGLVPKSPSEARKDDTERVLVLLRQMNLIDQEAFGSWMTQHLVES